MRAAVQRNLAPVHALEQEDHIARRLKNLHWRGCIHRTRNTGNEAMRRGIIVSTMRKFALVALGARPRLIGKDSVRRIDHHAPAAGYQSLGILFFETIVRAASIGLIETRQVRLAIGKTSDRGWWARRTSSS